MLYWDTLEHLKPVSYKLKVQLNCENSQMYAPLRVAARTRVQIGIPSLGNKLDYVLWAVLGVIEVLTVYKFVMKDNEHRKVCQWARGSD